MIRIQITEYDYGHDLYALVREFFPGMEVVTEILPSGERDFVRLIFCDDPEDQNSGRSRMIWLPDAKECGDRLVRKNYIKRCVFEALREDTGKEPPWGTLTGIRPVKLALSMKEEGRSDAEIHDYFRDEFETSDEKISLVTEIAGREKEILSKIAYRGGYSLYIGIPFCPTRCLYCSFTSYPISRWQSRVDEYLEALFKEIDYVSSKMSGRRLETIYIGGGTPTTLTASQSDRLLGKLESSFSLDSLLEFTVEAGRPDSITADKLKVLRAHGIRRISINPQTMQQKTLDLIGRKHTVQDTVDAFRTARDLGFTNINMDVIVGLPGETKDDAEDTMRQIRELEPDSLTVHSLAIKRAARLNTDWAQYASYKITNTAEIIDMTSRYARGMQLFPYYLYRQKNMAGNFENVGYAKVDKAGIYNILIMEEKQSIVAVGAGGSSKICIPEENRIERIENVKDVGEYISRVDEMIKRKGDEICR